MTKEELLIEFLSDPIALEYLNMKQEDVSKIRFGDKTSNKLIATIKETIDNEFNRANTDLQISKKVHSLLNQNSISR